MGCGLDPLVWATSRDHAGTRLCVTCGQQAGQGCFSRCVTPNRNKREGKAQCMGHFQPPVPLAQVRGLRAEWV